MKRIRNTFVITSLLTLAALVLSASINGQTPSSPKRELPAPTGKYAVGRTSFHWVDQSRAEEITDDPNDRRELMVTLWYPAERAKGETAPYFENLDKMTGAIDPVQAVFIRQVLSHTIAGAGISSAERRYAALIFSPGNGLNSTMYAAQIEDLASHGYIIIGIDHPYESFGVLYPDGRVARYKDLRPREGAPNFAEEQFRLYQQRVDWRAADARFVLNQLEKLNAGKPASQFSRRLDLSCVGGLGHSIGGVAAAQFCQSDRRFKACVNLDGHAKSLPLFPDSEGKGPAQTFMIFEKPLPEPTEKQLAEWKTTREKVERARNDASNRVADVLKTVKSGSYRVTLSGATHSSFSDEPLVISFGDEKLKAANRRRTEIIRFYTLAFFDQHLRGRNSNLLKGPSNDYPEVTVERFSLPQN